MAHSILEYGSKHIIIRDDDLMEVLQSLNEELANNPDSNLSFISEFMKSDLIHITGGIDPKLNENLITNEKKGSFLTLVKHVRKELTDSNSQQLSNNLQKLEDLVS